LSVRAVAPLVLFAWLGAAPAGVGAAELVKLQHAATLYADDKGIPLRFPQGVGCRAGEVLLVADSGNGRIVRFQVSGAMARTMGEVKLAEVPYPTQVDGDPAGNLVVLDGKSRRLARVKPDGTFGGFIDIPAQPHGPAPAVRAFAWAADGHLFVLDAAGRRVVVLAPGGEVERSVALREDAAIVTDIAVDARGTIYALDAVGRRVLVARPGEPTLTPLSGSLAEDLDFPGALAVDPTGRIFVTDQNGGGILTLGLDGSFRGRQSSYGWRDGYLRYPTDLCTGQDGTLVVADRENQRVQVFRVRK